jgi:hypothetical protein
MGDIRSPSEYTIATEDDIMSIEKRFVGRVKSFL